MSQIEWDGSYSVGNPEIDEQHKRWIELFNRMDERMLAGDQTALRNLASDSLNEMMEYTKYHFEQEEDYLRKIGYPEIRQHIRLHRNFEAQVHQYDREIRDGLIVLNSRIVKTIRNWLVNHILVEDRKYSQFAAGARHSQPGIPRNTD